MGNTTSKETTVVTAKFNVLAIEIGYSYLGIAYSFENQKDTIFTGTHNHVLPDDRIPNAVLVKPDGTLHSLGLVAQEEYLALKLEREDKGYGYFENVMPGKSLSNDCDADIDLKTILKMIIKDLYDKFKTELCVSLNDLSVMLVVPHDLKKPDQTLMLDAAIEAGIKRSDIRLVSDMDASSLYCCKQQLMVDNTGAIRILPNGTKYVSINLGGNTTKVCYKEIISDNEQREWRPANIINRGGTSVEDEFILKLSESIGAEELDEFKHVHFYDYREIIRKFEKRKWEFSGSIQGVHIEVPSTLKWHKDEGSEHSDKITLIDDKLIITKPVMERFFTPILTDVENSLKDVVECTCDPLVILSGGFSSSKYVREVLQQKISMNFVFLSNPELVVLKGAVLHDKEPLRKAEFSYSCTCSPMERNVSRHC